VSELIATGFKDPYRAAEVLNELQRRSFKWVAELDHALVVSHKEQDEITVQFCLDLNTEAQEVARARLWGSFLSLALFLPSSNKLVDFANDLTAATNGKTGAAVAARRITPDVRWWRESLCISDEFVRDVSAMIQPGDSALFMLLHTNELGSVLHQMRNHGGTPLYTTLSPEQDEQLNDLLASNAG